MVRTDRKKAFKAQSGADRKTGMRSFSFSFSSASTSDSMAKVVDEKEGRPCALAIGELKTRF